MLRPPVVVIPPTSSGSGFYTQLNNNFALLADALTNALDRFGSAPNQMESDLDMNSFRIINCADPIDPSDVVTLRFLVNEIGKYVASATVRWRGTWAIGNSYKPFDLVHNNGSVYINVKEHTASESDEPGVGIGWQAVWNVFVSAPDKKITADELADGAVTTTKIADGAVDASKIAPGLLTSTKTLTSLGLVGDGVTDDSTALKSALESVSNQGLTLDGEGRTFKIDGSINIKAGGFTIKNATFLLQDFNAYAAIEIAGSLGQEIPLTSDAVENEFSVSVLDVSGLEEGDIIMLSSDAVFETQTNSTVGQMLRVVSIDALTNVIVVDAPLFADFRVADNANIRKIYTQKNVYFEKCRFVGSGGQNIQVGLQLYAVEGGAISNCVFENIPNAALFLTMCREYNVTNNRFYDAERNGTGYGVSINGGSSKIHVTDNFGQNHRHLVTIGGYTYTCDSIIVKNNIAKQAREAGVDSHPACNRAVFEGNLIEVGPYPDNTAEGIVFQGRHGVIRGNDIVGCERGILVQSFNKYTPSLIVSGNNIYSNRETTRPQINIAFTDGADVDVVSITDNNVYAPNCTHNGIYLQSIGSGVKKAVISNNVVETSGATTFIYVLSSDTGVVKDVVVTGNLIKASAASSSIGVRIYAPVGASVNKAVVTANILSGSSTSSPVLINNYSSVYNVGNI